MNKLRLCVNLINLFFKFLLSKDQKVVDIFLVAFFSITLLEGKSTFLSLRIKVGITRKGKKVATEAMQIIGAFHVLPRLVDFYLD